MGGGDGEGVVAFDGVSEVDEDVEGEAVEDEGVEDADGGTFLEGTLFAVRVVVRAYAEAAGEIVEAGFGVWRASADAEIEAIEAFEG